MDEFAALRNQPRYEEIRDNQGVLISRRLIHEPKAPSECTTPCDGTGWTGNPRVPCTTHYDRF